MAQKLPDIRYKQIGQNLNVVVGTNAITIKGTKDELIPIKADLDAYIAKKSPALLKKIEEALKPKTTADAKKAEAEETQRVAQKKKVKKEIKETKVESKKEIKEEGKANKARRDILQVLLADKTLIANKDKFFLGGFESVALPELLVDRFIDFVQLKRSIEPLVNFWMLCLLNPNKVARYKLFAYLSKHRLLITPSGYFVTYRMVKTTDKPDVFTHAHSGSPKMYYKIGEVARLDRRTQCDEDGGKDCSRGLHTGSPDFIGIKVGEGYDKGEHKTKSQGGGQGTGYDSSYSTQKFDNSFGNQAVICLVNPMHVVSIPNSDTRKMRSCELYFAKTTTPEEVISHLTEADYLVYDTEYAGLEAAELRLQLKGAKLEDYSDGSVEALKGKKDSPSKAKLKALEQKLTTLSKSVLKEGIADDVSQSEMMRIITARTKYVEAPLIERLDTKGKKAVRGLLDNLGELAGTIAKDKKAPKEAKEKATEAMGLIEKGKEVYDKSIAEDETKAAKAKPTKETTPSTQEAKGKGKAGVSTKEDSTKQKEKPKPEAKVKVDEAKEGKGKPASKAKEASKDSPKEADRPKEANVPAKAVPKKSDKKTVDKDLVKEFVLVEWEKKKKAKKSPKKFFVWKSGVDGHLKVSEEATRLETYTLLGNLEELYNTYK